MSEATRILTQPLQQTIRRLAESPQFQQQAAIAERNTRVSAALYTMATEQPEALAILLEDLILRTLMGVVVPQPGQDLAQLTLLHHGKQQLCLQILLAAQQAPGHFT